MLVTIIVSDGGMSPTLESDNVALCLRDKRMLELPEPARGDVVLLSFEDKLLVKRVIAVGGDEVSVDEAGVVSVNGEIIDEDYVTALYGGSDVTYPITVPDGELFVMGDHRALAVDSRSRVFGTVPLESVAGRPVAVIWPAYNVAWLGLPGQNTAAVAADDEAAE